MLNYIGCVQIWVEYSNRQTTKFIKISDCQIFIKLIILENKNEIYCRLTKITCCKVLFHFSFKENVINKNSMHWPCVGRCS